MSGSKRKKNLGSRKQFSLFDDAPIEDPKQDRLGRRSFAESLAGAIQSMDARNGFVIALNGAWGSGKTTVLNFIEHYLKNTKKGKGRLVFHFNPWWFTHSEELLLHFLREFRLALKVSDYSKRLRDLGEKLEIFAKALAPFKLIPGAGAIVEPLEAVTKGAGAATSETASTLEKDVYSQRKQLDAALKKLPEPILVILDDIDRLTQEQIRQMFQLIKGVGGFPNVVYLLSLDRKSVINAFGHGIESGESYIGKIIQAQFDLPPVDKVALRQMLFERLNSLLRGTPEELWNDQYWKNVFWDGLDDSFKTPRDVKRLSNALQLTYPQVRGSVGFVDFVAIESLRIFYPGIYDYVRDNPDEFSGAIGDSGLLSTHAKPEVRKASLTAVLEQEISDAGKRDPVLRLLKRLFPKAGNAFGGVAYGADFLREWRKGGRAASPDIFPFFFSFALPRSAISSTEMKALLGLAAKPNSLEKQLQKLSKQPGRDGGTSRLKEFLERVEDYTAEGIEEAAIEPFLIALYNVADDFPEDDAGVFSHENSMRVMRITYQLLTRLPTQKQRAALFKRVILRSKSLYNSVRKVCLLGQAQGKYGERAGKPEAEWQVGKAHLADLEKTILKQLRSAATKSELSNNPNLASLLFRWRDLGDARRAQTYTKKLLKTDQGLIRLLESLLRRTRSFGTDDRAAKEEWVIPIKGLDTIMGDPKRLQGRVKKLQNKPPKGLKDRQKLALSAFLKSFRKPPQGGW